MTRAIISIQDGYAIHFRLPGSRTWQEGWHRYKTEEKVLAVLARLRRQAQKSQMQYRAVRVTTRIERVDATPLRRGHE